MTEDARRCYNPVAEMRKLFTTNQAADKLHVHRVTLQRWIASGRLKGVPKVGALGFRLWTARDIERVRKQITKRPHGKKGD